MTVHTEMNCMTDRRTDAAEKTVPPEAVLLLIDLQQGLDDPSRARSTPDLKRNIQRLLTVWRDADRPLVHVRHASTEPSSPLRPETGGFAFMKPFEPEPDEPVFEKTVNSAFITTELESYLHEHGHEQLVIVGLTTDHCVSTTTRMAQNLGFDPVVVSDGTATFARSTPDGGSLGASANHQAALAHLYGEFATIHTTADVLSLSDSSHL